MPELLWIVGFYAVAAAWVHAVMGRNNTAPRRHYVLVAGNQACRMEWYIRALRYFSRKTGADIAITVVLRDSTDESGKIVELFARTHDGIRLVEAEQSGSKAGAYAAAKPIEQPEQVESVEQGEPAEMRRRLLRALEADGNDASPEQVIWVELDRQEDLRQLPI